MDTKLSQKFQLVPSVQFVRIKLLEINKPHHVIFARRHISQFVSSILVTLQTEEEINVKIYLDMRYSNVFEDSDIEDINTGKKKLQINLYR